MTLLYARGKTYRQVLQPVSCIRIMASVQHARNMCVKVNNTIAQAVRALCASL